MIYNPFLFYVDEWFIKRKGLAFGIFWAGSGIGSALLPFLMEWALHKYGFRITLRAWAVLVVSPLVNHLSQHPCPETDYMGLYDSSSVWGLSLHSPSHVNLYRRRAALKL